MSYKLRHWVTGLFVHVPLILLRIKTKSLIIAIVAAVLFIGMDKLLINLYQPLFGLLFFIFPIAIGVYLSFIGKVYNKSKR